MLKKSAPRRNIIPGIPKYILCHMEYFETLFLFHIGATLGEVIKMNAVQQ